METILRTQKQLHELCDNIERFITEDLDYAVYRAPVIDYHHPEGYKQSTILGLKKFQSHAETERSYVDGLASSSILPKDFTTNAPHMLAVWDEFIRAQPPLVAISQFLDCDDQGQVKVDVICRGGDEWIKVNTIKESRLMAEFREQDSYINSDYDSDSSVDSASCIYSQHHAESSSAPHRRQQALAAPLTNSIISQATSLSRASKHYKRSLSLPSPRVTYVLSRMEEFDDDPDRDPRVEETFRVLREMGINVVCGPLPTPVNLYGHGERKSEEQIDGNGINRLTPMTKIMLDLSVIIALCCDSSHLPLPASDDELEARFRPLGICQGENGESLGVPVTVELVPHSSVTKDLRDQLEKEMEHPLIKEMQERLEEAISLSSTTSQSNGSSIHPQELEFWVTKEVKERLPNLVEVIGGVKERRRAKALFGEGQEGESFWQGSRWEGKEGVLKNLKVHVLADNCIDSTSGDHKAKPTVFQQGLIEICGSMLATLECRTTNRPLTSASTSRTSSSASSISRNTPRRPMAKGQKSQYPKRGPQSASINKLPSGHTLRTMLEGSRRGWTVLTNNRGAVGKIIREMGVIDGLPSEEVTRAAIWVVNPSSLSEWRRTEVDNANEAIRASLKGHRPSC